MTKLRHWFPSLPFQQFQVLFNSLFKVLCIFPSRYLCTIGVPPIFSFRWNLPPNLSCNPKQLDSQKALCQGTMFPGKNGSFTLSAALFQETWPGPTADKTSPDHNSMHHSFPASSCIDSHGELIPLHSPLLRKSLLVSFPPLINMLKFSG